MPRTWAWLALFLSSPALAAPLPEGAEQRMLPFSESTRLMRLFTESIKNGGAKQCAIYTEQKKASDQLMAELYGPSPDLALVERLDKRLKELGLQSQHCTEQMQQNFYHSLSHEDQLKFMKMNHPLPPILVIPDKPKTQSKTPAN